MVRWVKLDSWVRSLLVDPIGKSPLEETRDGWRTSYGAVYPVAGSIPDLRRRFLATTPKSTVWHSGQLAYERWSRQLIKNDARQDYVAEIEGVRPVYRDIPIAGRVLDVGGHQGRLREFLDQEQEYLACDPFINVFDGIEKQQNLLSTYKCFVTACNFVACHAEYLPFKENSFDTVHMRSVIDHFFDPDLATVEAFRVLRPGGKLVVGLTVEGGRSGRASTRDRAKELARVLLPWIGIDRYTDHHIWHPTYAALTALIESNGFSIRTEHWQAAHHDRVCYLEAIKMAR